MSCSCHIAPPCGFCMEHHECHQCGDVTHEDSLHEINGQMVCSKDKCISDAEKQW
jgi:formylmethanofuran dehydrogenase subunit E